MKIVRHVKRDQSFPQCVLAVGCSNQPRGQFGRIAVGEIVAIEVGSLDNAVGYVERHLDRATGGARSLAEVVAR